MAIAESTRQQIILGAVQMTGPVSDNPGEWNGRLLTNAKELTTLLNEQSDVSKTITIMDEAKKFVGTVLYVGKEKKSTRGFVVLRTWDGKTKEHKLENVRTERTDSGDSVVTFAKHLRENLTGHRVVVYVELQVGSDDRKYRVLHHAVDLGPDTDVTDELLAEAKEHARANMK